MTTDRERWLRLSRLFDQAIDLEGEARDALIAAECADDPDLRHELQQMLDADAAASGIDAGAAGAIALTDAEDDDTPATDDRLGAWRLQHLLGRGGMGSVHAAQREGDDTGQHAAIKRLHRRWDGSGQAQRFLQERRILASLSHPNLPRLIDHGLDAEGRPWFALEYVDGDTLVDWADAQRIDLRGRIDLFRQVCAAVQHAHERFVVHRDLKPANILVDRDGHPKVLDFGVAKRLDHSEGTTRTGMFAGFTPEYAAPEQISGGPITAATDVYALGVILYQLLTGQLPYRFEHNNLRDTADAITSRTAERLDRALTTGEPGEVAQRVQHRNTSASAFRRFVRGDLTRIVQTALAKEPARRYSSVQALSTDLKRFLEGRPVSVSGDTTGYHARKFVQRNRWGVGMAGLAALALVAAFIGIGLKNRQAQAAAARAEAEAVRARAQESRAKEEATRAKASRDFVTSLLGEASPERNQGRDPTVRELLDTASTRIDRELADQPGLRIETMTVIASAYSDLSLYDQAYRLLDRAVRLANKTPTLEPVIRANAHAKHAYALLSQGKTPEAEAEARTAIGLLKDGSQEALHAEALSTLATTQYIQDAFGPALESQQASTRIVAAHEGLRSKAYAESLVELSYFQDGADKQEAAIASAAQAAAMLTDPADPATTRALWAYGNALSGASRDAEAIAPLAKSLGLVGAIYGTKSLKYMRNLQLLGAAEVGAGRLADAGEHLGQAARLLAAQAPQHPLASIVQLDLAEAELRSGSAAKAAARLRELLQFLQKNPSNATDREIKASLLLARSEDALQRHSEAKAILDDLAARSPQPEPAMRGLVLIAIADNARLRSDLEGAGNALQQATDLFANHDSRNARADIALAQARLAQAQGAPDARRKAASRALALLEQRGATASPEYLQAQSLRH